MMLQSKSVREILKKITFVFFHGFFWMFGVVIASSLTVLCLILIYPYVEKIELIYDVKQRISFGTVTPLKSPPLENIEFDNSIPVNSPAASRETYYVSNSNQLIDAVRNANSSKVPVEVVLSPGVYLIERTLEVNVDDFFIRSLENEPNNTVLKGKGMYGDTGNIFRIKGKNFHLRALTLSDSNLHLIQIAGESSANFPIIEDSILRDSKEQFIKISYDLNTPNLYSVGGVVRNCYFYFSRGIAPHYYTGGVDGHGVRHWQIINNIFSDIASPSKYVAEHAIHLWNNSAFNLVSGNVIVDSDRGIGFGMGVSEHPNVIYGNLSGRIENNFIFQSNNNQPFSDAAIIVESSPSTSIINNFSFSEHPYPRSIEYRFKSTIDVEIANNRVNRRIASRDSAMANVYSNSEFLSRGLFMSQVLQHAKTSGLINRYPEFFTRLEQLK